MSSRTVGPRISEAIRGNDDEAESSFGDAVETVEEEIESEGIIDRAIELITRLARQLGLDVERVLEPTEWSRRRKPCTRPGRLSGCRCRSRR
jgi:hypothetical protein